jgi:hypothetical protein
LREREVFYVRNRILLGAAQVKILGRVLAWYYADKKPNERRGLLQYYKDQLCDNKRNGPGLQ